MNCLKEPDDFAHFETAIFAKFKDKCHNKPPRVGASEWTANDHESDPTAIAARLQQKTSAVERVETQEADVANIELTGEIDGILITNDIKPKQIKTAELLPSNIRL